MIVAAAIALFQISAARSGKSSIITWGLTTILGPFETGTTSAFDGLRDTFGNLGRIPQLARDNAQLEARARALAAENARLREAASQEPDLAALERALQAEPGGIAAATIGFDPENQSRSVTLDKGSNAGVKLDAGVVNEDGVVGRVVAVEPFTSSVLLLTDPDSKVPAVVQRGRWWGIATGTTTRVQLRFVSQDARLRLGDTVVTGTGRSFGAGVTIGRIVRIFHSEGALYQTAAIEPSVAFGRLHHVVVLPR